jgi:hypothetical protein
VRATPAFIRGGQRIRPGEIFLLPGPRSPQSARMDHDPAAAAAAAAARAAAAVLLDAALADGTAARSSG